MKKQFILLVIVSVLIFGSVVSVANAVGNTLNTTLNLQDIGSLPSVPEVPTINVQPSTTYTYTLSITNNILLGNDISRKVSIVSVKPRLPNSFILGDPVVCPSNFEEVRLSNNSRDVGIINCVEVGLDTTSPTTTSNPQYDITYGQTGSVSFTFTTPSSGGITDLSLGIGSINSAGVLGTGQWSPAVHISVANPACTANDWSCTNWGECHADGNYFQNRTCSKTKICEGGVASPSTQQICTPPFCTSWTYTDWGVCDPILGYQSRNEISAFPHDCIIDYTNGPGPINRQTCSVFSACTLSDWSCTNWGTCSQNGSQVRTCAKASNCQGGVNSPITSQSCTLPLQPIQPSCTTDTWTCENWNACSISGVQNRSCKITFDCPSVVTAPPVTDQYCEAPNKPTQQVPPDSSEIANQGTIIKATVKLICPLDANRASQASGTIIDSIGTILTNQHVISGTLGCLVGFINNFNDEPYFGNRQIADIVKESSSEDVAVLKLRNPQNSKLSFVDITKGSSNNLRLGTNVNIYGYPAKFGTNMTYTSGSFSGTSGSYLKTSAIIEHGNSGGGAYLNDGTFIGIPSGVIKGELNALGYILSISTINSWLGNSPSVAHNNNSNNYSRVSSLLENIDLEKLDSLQLVIPGTNENKEITNNSSGVVNPVFTRSLKKGMSGDDVKQLQTLLKKLNYFPIDQDTTNYFGAITHAAVIKFQKDNNIKPVAGLFGPLTQAKILSLNK